MRDGFARSIVHVGYHKTASTWFQRRFYPRVTGHRYVDRRRVKDALLGESSFAFDADRALSMLRDGAADRPLILCEEELSGNLHSGGLFGCLARDVVRRVHETLPDASIVIFLRNQVDAVAAAYKQYLREGGTHRPSRYLHPHDGQRGMFASPYKWPRFSMDHFGYAGLLDCYAEAFGRENVHVFLYEQFRADGRGFLGDFVRRLGIDVDVEGAPLAGENVSYGRNVVRTARVLNRLSARNVSDKRYWIDLLPHTTRKGLLESLNRSRFSGASADVEWLLGVDQVAAIRERFAQSNRALAERWSLPLGDWGYPLPR